MLKKIYYTIDRYQRRNIVILGILMIIGSFFELLGITIIMPIVNIITDESIIYNDDRYSLLYKISGVTSVRQFIIVLCIVSVAVYVIKNVYLVFEYYIQYRFTYNNRRKLAVELYQAYVRKDYLFHTSTNVAEIKRDIEADSDTFYKNILCILQFLTECISLLVIVIYLFIIDWLATSCIGIMIGAASAIFFIVYKKLSVSIGRANRVITAEIDKSILQAFGAIKDVKILEKEDNFISFYENNVIKYSKIMRKNGVLGVIPRPFMEVACVGSLLGVITIKIARGDSLKVFVSTLAVLVVAAFRMLPSFSKIVGYFNQIMFGKPAVDYIYYELKNIRHENIKYKTILNDNYKFQMDNPLIGENITFAYPNKDQYVFNNASFEFLPNKTYGIIGSSGSGKSTLADMILGLIKPQKGVISIAGEDILKHTYAWHMNVGYIPQEIYLLDDTIKSNVAFGLSYSEIDENRVWEMLEKAQLADFVRGLPNGIDTIVGEKGTLISGGQRQRIGIARALYVDPKFLVMDEATSALDNDTEAAVVKSIEKLHGSLTLIIITHRLTTIQNCDLIYKVEDGKIEKVDKESLKFDVA